MSEKSNRTVQKITHYLPLIVNVGVCVSTGIVFRLNFASCAGRFRVEAARVTSDLNTGRRKFGLFHIDRHARLTFGFSWLIRFKSSLSWCVSFFGTFMSAFVLFQFSRWGMYACFKLNPCANKDIHLHHSRLMSLIFGPSCCCHSENSFFVNKVKYLRIFVT